MEVQILAVTLYYNFPGCYPWGKVSKWDTGIFLYNFLQMHENPQCAHKSGLIKRKKKNRVEPSSI